MSSMPSAKPLGIPVRSAQFVLTLSTPSANPSGVPTRSSQFVDDCGRLVSPEPSPEKLPAVISPVTVMLAKVKPEVSQTDIAMQALSATLAVSAA